MYYITRYLIIPRKKKKSYLFRRRTESSFQPQAFIAQLIFLVSESSRTFWLCLFVFSTKLVFCLFVFSKKLVFCLFVFSKKLVFCLFVVSKKLVF